MFDDEFGYSGSGRSSVTWHSAHTHVRSTCLVASSRRSVQGMNARRPQRGQRSGDAPAGIAEGSHGIFAGIAGNLTIRILA
jgi:hypothetical protein